MENPDYSMYKYYKGEKENPFDNVTQNKKHMFWFYESCFEITYKGKPEDKEEAFKDYMSDLLWEKASDMYMFGYPGVDNGKCYGEFISYYFNPDMK
jgi:hypothetical protein